MLDQIVKSNNVETISMAEQHKKADGTQTENGDRYILTPTTDVEATMFT